MSYVNLTRHEEEILFEAYSALDNILNNRKPKEATQATEQYRHEQMNNVIDDINLCCMALAKKVNGEYVVTLEDVLSITRRHKEVTTHDHN